VTGPLAGKRILVTRARHQAGQLTASLAALGAEVIEIPAIEIVPPDSFASMDAALGNLDRYQWLILASANAVRAMRDRLAALNLTVASPSSLKIAAVGPATAQAVEAMGLSVTLTPPEYVAESLASALSDQVSGARVLILRAAVARDVIPDALRAAGAQVDVVEAYRTAVPEESSRLIVELFSGSQPLPDAATFTSSSTVINFFRLMQDIGIEHPPASLRAVSIGPITSQTLRNHGWEPAAEADPHTVQGLVNAVLQILA
jgi:uroporphyrinogen-III synthase